MIDTKRIPKVELHVHVEAIASHEALKDMLKKHNLSASRLESLQHAASNGYQNIEDFFNYWHLLNSALKEPEDFERVVYEYLIELNSYNTKYCELNLNVLRQEQKQIDVSKIIDAIFAAQRSAEDETGIVSRTILSYSRDFSIAEGKRIVDMVQKYSDKNVVAIDIAGNEKKYPNSNFIDVFKYAKTREINRVAHAGEAAMQNSIQDAVEKMSVSRIGHGADSIQDEKLLLQIKDKKILIELCPTSNVELGIVKSIEEHPGKFFIKNGFKVCINSDDPALLNQSLQDEYDLVTEKWNLDKNDLAQIYKNGINAAFIENEIKEDLLKASKQKI